MKSKLSSVFAYIFCLFWMITAPVMIQAQIDPSKLIELPTGGSIDLPVDAGGIDLPMGSESDLSGMGEGGGVLDLLKNNNPLGPDPGGDPGDIPVDGGLGFLLAAGLGYGANRLRKHRQNKQQTDK